MLRASFDLVSTDATRALAQGLASVLRSGDVVALTGELGAGKTTFVRGVVEALGGDQSLVASPTFVFVHVYPIERSAAPEALAASRKKPIPAMAVTDGKRADRIDRVAHIDAYRLTSSEDLEPLGWDRLFRESAQAAAGSVAFVEWPQRIAGHLPEEQSRANILIEHLREDVRRFTLVLPDAWGARSGVDLLVSRPPAVCPKTRVWVSPTNPTYPFVDERSRGGDLYGWLTESYKVSREVKEDDAGETDE